MNAAPMSTATLPPAFLSLSVAERVALANQLYASLPEEWQKETDYAWLDEAARRSSEIDVDPGSGLSHEEFVAGIKTSRTPK
ncbi:MAG: putative addiction module component, family [Verrucomicrobiaceae bacterium]|nr:putative addiction module component, family [Verrucomicrobiaceae bacterium]